MRASDRCHCRHCPNVRVWERKREKSFSKWGPPKRSGASSIRVNTTRRKCSPLELQVPVWHSFTEITSEDLTRLMLFLLLSPSFHLFSPRAQKKHQVLYTTTYSPNHVRYARSAQQYYFVLLKDCFIMPKQLLASWIYRPRLHLPNDPGVSPLSGIASRARITVWKPLDRGPDTPESIDL